LRAGSRAEMTVARMALLAPWLLVACNSDPYKGLEHVGCMPGNVREGENACTIGSAVVSAPAGGWNGVPVIPLSMTCVSPPCSVAPMPVSLQLANSTLDTWNAFAFHVTLDGP